MEVWGQSPQTRTGSPPLDSAGGLPSPDPLIGPLLKNPADAHALVCQNVTVNASRSKDRRLMLRTNIYNE